MSDEEEEDSEPTVELGEGQPVEGAPLARIVSRSSWPQEKSRIIGKFGDESIRTPDGPRTLDEILAEIDTTYFASRHEFVRDIESVIGNEPIPNAE